MGGINCPSGETVFEMVKAEKRPARDEAELIFSTILMLFSSKVVY